MIVLKFYKDDCEPCNILNQQLQNSTLPIRNINTNDDKDIDILLKFKVKSLPTIIFCDDDYNELKRLNRSIDGSINPELIEKTYKKLQEKFVTL